MKLTFGAARVEQACLLYRVATKVNTVNVKLMSKLMVINV